MYKGKKVVVVMPAYNAALTLEKTYREIPLDLVDAVILCDDNSKDNTIEVAHSLGIAHIIAHDKNKGYGGNQKSLYNKALTIGADIVIMVHPDYQYTPKLIPSMVNIIGEDLYPVVLGSRILGSGALRGGMPLYKYIANRFLTASQNLLVNYKLSEYHTGYRAFSRAARIYRENISADSDAQKRRGILAAQRRRAGKPCWADTSKTGAAYDPPEKARPALHHGSPWRNACGFGPSAPCPMGRRVCGARPASLRDAAAR